MAAHHYLEAGNTARGSGSSIVPSALSEPVRFSRAMGHCVIEVAYQMADFPARVWMYSPIPYCSPNILLWTWIYAAYSGVVQSAANQARQDVDLLAAMADSFLPVRKELHR